MNDFAAPEKHRYRHLAVDIVKAMPAAKGCMKR